MRVCTADLNIVAHRRERGRIHTDQDKDARRKDISIRVCFFFVCSLLFCVVRAGASA